MTTKRFSLLAAFVCCGPLISAGPAGVFEKSSDVGTVLNAGSVEYDAAKKAYTVAGSGENIWAAADGFQYVWKRVSGDVTIGADIAFIGTGGNAHRKAVLMVRQSLDADSVYVDAAVHGVGLTSIQAREEKGGATHEVQANITAPKRLRLEKRGDTFYMLVAGEGEQLRLGGGSKRIVLKELFYVGIGVCAHDPKVVEKAVFSNVELVTGPPAKSKKPALYSTLEVVPVSTTDCRTVWVGPGRIESPNWTKDGATIVYNSNGRIYRVPAAGGKPEVVDTGFATRVNGHHGVSPDGTQLAISDQSRERGRSIVYIVPAGGGVPKRVTAKAPSYFQGWSPDGKTIVFTGERDGKRDIYTIPASGGEETRLTTAKGINDGARYSPEGKIVYFNSDRSGSMQIWRMQADGTGQEQVTSGDAASWFPQVSPNGRQLVFLSVAKEVTGRPADKYVTMRMMAVGAQQSSFLTGFLGGAGTMDGPAWSPDGRNVAFVSYQLRP
jgi:hypothetical protein